jgi:hypothetical protein
MVIGEIIYQIGLKNVKRVCCDGVASSCEFNIFQFNKNNYYQLVLDKQGKYKVGNINEKMTKIKE